MKINKKELIASIIILLVLNIGFWVVYSSEMNNSPEGDKLKIWPGIIASVSITLLIILLGVFVTKEKIERIKNIFKNIGLILIALSSSGMIFLGIKFNNFWFYLIAVVGFFVLIKLMTKFRKNIFKTSERIGKNISKKIGKKHYK